MTEKQEAGSTNRLRICILHGYLLSGTGSNIFVNNLVRKFCQYGHDVLLFCQEKRPEAYDFISRYCVFSRDNRQYRTVFESETHYPGSCTLYNPDIDGLLPVYVYDEYEGFKVKTFTELSPEEIDAYISKNVEAVETVYNENGFDLVQTNHVIMSSYIARVLWKRCHVPYYMSLHGSALNFSVKKKESLRGYAAQALLDAKGIFAVSNHNRLEAMTYFKDIASDIKQKFKVIPAGVDTQLFRIRDDSKQDSIEDLKKILLDRTKLLHKGKSRIQKCRFLSDLEQTSSVEEVDRLVSRYNAKYDQGHPDRDILETLDRIDWEKDRVVIFVGKYLWTKGIQMVISALPIVLNRIPDLHLLLVGFGSYREELEALVYSLDSGRRELFRYLIEKSNLHMGPGDNPEAVKPFKFLDALAERKEVKNYFRSAQMYEISRHVHFIGALSHIELSRLLPCADGFVAASLFPEAFGMVSIEALACGVLPIVSNQTGFKEIVDLVSRTVSIIEGSPRVDINEDMVFNIAANIAHNIENGVFRNSDFKRRLRQITLDHFSWDSIAKKYISYYV
jgi:glycosyltransferase involved in cell wall biosynthesis